MTDKELHQLRRADMLELMSSLAEENEALRKKNSLLNDKLQQRTIQVREAGSIAEAALKINGVFETAQAAADQYLDNVHQLYAGVQKQADDLLAEAKNKCAAIEADMQAKCVAMEDEAKAKCAAMEAEAKAKCAAMEAEAEAKCAAMEAETEAKCAPIKAQTEAKCAAIVAETEARCAAMETETKAKCAAMKAETEVTLEQKLKTVYEWLNKSNEVQQGIKDQLDALKLSHESI